ncbi:MAG: acetylxylan esterase [Rikenellaceae bacterium]
MKKFSQIIVLCTCFFALSCSEDISDLTGVIPDSDTLELDLDNGLGGWGSVDDDLDVSLAYTECYPWPLDTLYQTPKYYSTTNSVEGVEALIYEPCSYRGAPKTVFAYYCTPGILAGDRSLDVNLPAMVCLHGGGGEAFSAWVIGWAERGYAAIAMDLFGKGADSKNVLENGYNRITIHYAGCLEDDYREDLAYSAICDAVSANSLLRSFDEIDKTRIGVTGVSWGGVFTSMVCGIDTRFAAAAPVYGCGYIYEVGSMISYIQPYDYSLYRWSNWYDAAVHIPKADIPILFANGNKDSHFYMNQTESSARLAKYPYRSIGYGIKHNQSVGSTLEEVYNFMDYHLMGDEQSESPKFIDFKVEDDKLTGSFTTVEKQVTTYFIYTTTEEIDENASWARVEITPGDNNAISVDILDTYTVYFVSVVYSSDGANYSSEIFFRDDVLFN